MRNTIARGSEAELIVATKAVKNGFVVSFPISHSSEYDLIVDTGKLYRVQVKRAYKTNNHGTEVLCVETRRILVKHSGVKGSVAGKYSDNGYDYLIAVDCDSNDFWVIPREIAATYKAQIYLTSKKAMAYKNEWAEMAAGSHPATGHR